MSSSTRLTFMQSSLFLLLLTIACFAQAAACVAPVATCTEWITLAGGPARTLVYRNHSLEAKNESITRAVIVIHGQGRDADNYYRHALAAAFLANALENTLVVSPRFASNEGRNCRDTLAADELNWVCLGAESWRSGGSAVGRAEISAIAVVDEILQKLASRVRFPNLKSIVVAGHSAGGQYVTRYEMLNRVHEKLGVPITYVVANPSSYTYLDALRPTPTALPAGVAAGAPGYTPAVGTKPPAPFADFSDATGCTSYNNWPYGIQRRTGHAAKVSDDDLKRQLAGRPTTYLLGELDILPLYGFDGSCAAMAQGPTRFARGLAYAKYVNEKLGANHKVVIVPACGHNARCMFGSDVALPLLFAKE